MNFFETIPFSSFVCRDDKNAVFDPVHIQNFGFWSAVTSNVQTVTFDKLLNGDEVTMGDINGDTEVNSIDY